MRTFILLIIYILLTILLIPVLLFCYPLKFPLPIILIGKAALWLGPKILGIRLDASGLDRIDKRTSYVFMANHLSLMDGPLIFMLIPQFVRVLLKKEAFKIPVIGLAMRQVGFVSVDRKGLKGGKKSIDRATRMIKEKGFSFLIFPEGTRSRDGKLQPFKRGGFFLAINSQVPIFPVSIKGSYALMPKGSFFVKKGKVGVMFHPPVSIKGFNKDNLSQLINKVRSVIQSGLD
ncbi:MAG: 1-acyl-sn-glycerol-3-phosphate acyltransferase [Candidatus Aminicenantes bacterium]|nr:1-acyl-sn-glycerol-3-phosphate acyltransferase [Candidatus Aminicenantes bacterium]